MSLNDKVLLMKMVIIFLFVTSLAHAQQDNFKTEARSLASDLKLSLMKNLSEKIAQDGVVAAVPFCHENVKRMAKAAAQGRATKYEFGRTSHKIRNKNNTPQAWAIKYLDRFAGTKKGDISEKSIIHKLKNSKRIYLEPLYVEAKCLLCHGEGVSKNVQSKIHDLYPNDKAIGFKLGEFRGFIWVKEK